MNRPSMALGQLLQDITPVPTVLDRTITGLASDSRQVRRGDLFLATRGLHHHGLEFLPTVRAAGAAAVVWEPPWEGRVEHDLPLLTIENLSHKQVLIAERFYGNPSHHLDLIGITGTDGKTSCAHFIAQALSLHEGSCGLLGTLGYGVYGQTTTASHTTPDALTLVRLLAGLQTQGVGRVAMEVSSHALDQGRVEGLDFAVAVLTNLTRDHLDYHGDANAYAKAKRRLFLNPQTAVLNLDDGFGQQLATELPGSVVNYGLGSRPNTGAGAYVWGGDLETSPTGLGFKVHSSWGEGVLHSRLLGRFNASNLLAALATLLVLEVPLAQALKYLAQVSTVAGRMERFGGSHGLPIAVVDYAHTPHSLEQSLQALREHVQGQLWCVFGCGGDRDPGKRPQMGAIAERYADRVIVTNDNPRNEQPARIVQHILAEMQHPQAVQVLEDRGAAIASALEQAQSTDLVLIAGKGHEDYQLLGSERLPFSDRQVVQQWLEART